MQSIRRLEGRGIFGSVPHIGIRPSFSARDRFGKLGYSRNLRHSSAKLGIVLKMIGNVRMTFKTSVILMLFWEAKKGEIERGATVTTMFE